MTATKFNSEITDKIEDMITEVIFSNSLFDFGKRAKELMTYASKNDLKVETVLNELFQNVESQYFADLEDAQYQHLRKDNAVRMFLYVNWSAFRQENASLSDAIYIEKLLLEISHNKGLQVDDGKAENLVQKLMELVGAEINILAALPDKHSVNIAFVDQPETRYEGYMNGHMPFVPDRTYHHIIVSNFTDDKTDAERIHGFIKAIGYIYLLSLTGSFEKMPKGFSAIQKIFTPKLDSGMELFAECFAMVLCINPGLKKYDTQPEIPLSVKQQVYKYMIDLGKRRSPTQFHINQTKFPS